MLYGRRQRVRRAEEAEARGESLWSEKFSPQTRVRIQTLVELTLGRSGEAARFIDNLMRLDVGQGILSGGGYASTGLHNAFVGCSHELMPSLIEATYQAVEGSGGNASEFEQGINTVLSEHRLAFKMTNGLLHPFSSLELHEQVVEPALRLLAGKAGWDKVESAYQDALREIGDGNAADAITDAARALQEALTLLGAAGNSLGPLAKSARKMGLLGPHDSGLAEGLQKIIDWVSADRSETGEAHKMPEQTVRDDAWLAVHVVGALILRLTEGPRTSGS